MDLKEQRYVCTLAECGNLTRAADRLYISQPALSIYISNLEKHLGMPLFCRQGKRFILTKAGERYVHYARGILAISSRFDSEMSMLLSDEAGRLRMGISVLRGAWFLPRVLKDFHERWPKVELVLRQGNMTFLKELPGGRRGGDLYGAGSLYPDFPVFQSGESVPAGYPRAPAPGDGGLSCPGTCAPIHGRHDGAPAETGSGNYVRPAVISYI